MWWREPWRSMGRLTLAGFGPLLMQPAEFAARPKPGKNAEGEP